MSEASNRGSVPSGYHVVVSGGLDSPRAPSLFEPWKWEVIGPHRWECRGFAFTRWGARRKGIRIARRIARRREKDAQRF